MIKFFYITLITISPFLSTAQTITFEEVQNATESLDGHYDTYIAEDGTSYSIGDEIEFGDPSGDNGQFQTAQQLDINNRFSVRDKSSTGVKSKINRIKIWVDAAPGFQVGIQSKGNGPNDNYMIFIEPALSSGEVK